MKLQNNIEGQQQPNLIDNWADMSLRLLLLKSYMHWHFSLLFSQRFRQAFSYVILDDNLSDFLR